MSERQRKMEGFRCKVDGSGLKVQGSRFKGAGSGLTFPRHAAPAERTPPPSEPCTPRVGGGGGPDLGFRVYGLGFRV